MNHSIEFVKRRLEKFRYTYSNKIHHIETPKALKMIDCKPEFRTLPWNFTIICEGNKMPCDVTVEYEPRAEYDYYASTCSIHDGTLLFEYEAVARCLNKLLNGSYYILKGRPQEEKPAKIKYVIGDIVIDNIFHKHGVNHSWPEMETLVYLPIKYDWEYID